MHWIILLLLLWDQGGKTFSAFFVRAFRVSLLYTAQVLCLR